MAHLNKDDDLNREILGALRSFLDVPLSSPAGGETDQGAEPGTFSNLSSGVRTRLRNIVSDDHCESKFGEDVDELRHNLSMNKSLR